MPQGTAVALDTTKRGELADSLYDDLSHLVVGQDAAVARVVDTYQMVASGLNAQGRPLASFLFLGPTGTGKTRLVESLAQVLHGSTSKLVKIDCAEFQHGHEIAKLIGSPPGYLGHRETRALLDQGALTEVRSDACPVSIVLFDEIEKASDTLWNLLLGVLDKAVLTLGDNRKVDFSQCIIFLTSNLGSKEISRLTGPSLGFAPPVGAIDDVSRVGTAAARQKFTPEFMNRLDSTVVFQPLTEGNLREILELELHAVQNRIMTAIVTDFVKVRFLLNLRDSAKEQLLTLGNDPKYGARFLKRTIEKLIMRPLINLLTSGQVQDGDVIWVEKDGEELEFSREAHA